MFPNWFINACAVFILASAPHAQSRDTLAHSVDSTPGWMAVGTPEIYTESTIEKFSPDQAPILKSYGLDGVTVATWQNSQGRVRTTLYQMIDASAAYGFFSVRRHSESTSSNENAVGSESFVAGNSLYFWQSGFVVKLEGEQQTVIALATLLSKTILGSSQKPPITNHLPSANMVAGSEEYILNPMNVESSAGIVPAKLGFDFSAEAASASYRINGKTAQLLLLQYPTQQIAKKYEDQLRAAAPDLESSRKRIGPLLAIVSGSNDPKIVQSILGDVHYESKVTWDEPPPGLGLGPIIVTVFTFIGILLAFCVIVGISLGGLRIFMKARYPDRVFDRAQNMEIIQLKLDQGLTRKELGE